MAKWRINDRGPMGRNEVLEGAGFYVSFNAAPGEMAGLPMVSALFGSDDRGSETALCHDGKFFILNGDFRKDYERLAPDGFDACLAFYRQHAADHNSSWSSGDEATA